MADITHDIIFAGGGTTACITAGRLAAAEPGLKILILEAGPHSKDLHYHVQPARYFSNLLLGREIFSFHAGKGGDGTGGRIHVVPSGRAVGGGSSVNIAVYTRPAASDYDDWETVYGNDGWSSKYLIPLLQKAETYQVEPELPLHGYSGPIKVSVAKEGYNIGEELVNVASAFEPEHGRTNDITTMNEESLNKWARAARYVDGETGRRSDSAHRYIYSADHKNLTILARHKVVRVVFEGTKAVGVEYIDDTIGRSKGTPEKHVAKARLVVVSGGAFGTPAILERSGIGATHILQKHGVEPLVDLPGVGENYMDHNLMVPAFYASEDAETLDLAFRGSEEDIKAIHDQWLETGGGIMANNGVDGGARLRPTETELKTMKGFEERWNSYYAPSPDKPVMLMATLAGYIGSDPQVPRSKYFTVEYFSAHPASIGSVHITSGTDAYSALDFRPGFLSDPSDAVTLRWAYKRARELARRIKYFRGELAASHPSFSETSEAALLPQGSLPLALDAPRIQYSAEDDAAIDEYIKQNAETTWHSLGTAAMKPRQQGGVLDSKLNVYGTTNLKVADLSICPANVSSNTYSSAIAIGEKAAVIIAKELGIGGFTSGP